MDVGVGVSTFFDNLSTVHRYISSQLKAPHADDEEDRGDTLLHAS